LQKEFSPSVKDPKMNRPVEEVIHMNLSTEAGFQDPVLGINHIAHLMGVVMPLWGDMKGQISPLIDTEILGAGGDRMPLRSRPFFPDSGREFEEGSELLAARGKSLTN
jgi:hypothetical protein